MKLVSMTEFVLKQTKQGINDASTLCIDIYQYAKFLSQPLTLGMFVACDLDGNVLVKWKCKQCLTVTPDDCHSAKECSAPNENEYVKYEKGKQRVLFKGFKVCNRDLSMGCVSNGDFHLSTGFKFTKTIEDMVIHKPTLTKTAIKQLEL